jgi:hypothetical protein
MIILSPGGLMPLVGKGWKGPRAAA